MPGYFTYEDFIKDFKFDEDDELKKEYILLYFNGPCRRHGTWKRMENKRNVNGVMGEKLAYLVAVTDDKIIRILDGEQEYSRESPFTDDDKRKFIDAIHVERIERGWKPLPKYATNSDGDDVPSGEFFEISDGWDWDIVNYEEREEGQRYPLPQVVEGGG
jgi:hypothetical protein